MRVVGSRGRDVFLRVVGDILVAPPRGQGREVRLADVEPPEGAAALQLETIAGQRATVDASRAVFKGREPLVTRGAELALSARRLSGTPFVCVAHVRAWSDS